MNTYGGKDLARAFRTVRNNTIQIAEEIPEDKYGFQASPDSRSIRQQLLHIANGGAFQYHLHAEAKRSNLDGFNFMEFMMPFAEEEKKPYSKAEIIQQLKDGGDKIEKWLEGLGDEFLGEIVSFPAHLSPPTKSRFEMIMSIKEHEMHHRGQLMAWQRIIGITPHTTRAREETLKRMKEQAETAKS